MLTICAVSLQNFFHHSSTLAAFRLCLLCRYKYCAWSPSRGR